MPTIVETATIRPGRLNVDTTEGDAWTLQVVLSRGGTPVNLTGATITTRFKPLGGGGETTLVYQATNLAAGLISIGQAEAVSGNYAIVVAETGATARTMVKGSITAERVL